MVVGFVTRMARCRVTLIYAAILTTVTTALVALGLGGRAPAQAPPATLGADAFAAAREAVEARRVRNALDAWRAGRGAWPERLDALSEAGWIEHGALTSPTGAPYYYRWRADGVVLLSPER